MKYLKASGAKIKAARRAANLTQAQLGEKMGVSGSMIGQWETEARRPSLKTAKEVAELLQIDVDTLLVSFEADDFYRVPVAAMKEDVIAKDLMMLNNIMNASGYALNVVGGEYYLLGQNGTYMLDKTQLSELRNSSFQYIEYLCAKLESELSGFPVRIKPKNKRDPDTPEE